jgi:glycosyltransferase involved in cell wall biosynthesis
MSSVSEGLPMSLLQAMSIGIPAIVTDVGGMAEVVRLSGGGLLAPVGDSAAMAEAIVTMAGDPDLRAELSRRAREAYWAEFTLERMEAAYMEIYRRR